MPSPLAVRTQVPGAVSARIDDLDGRRIVIVDIDPARKAGALNSADGATLTAAAELALAERIPLVACVASAGADVNEGIAPLHGWGRTARALVACSGIVPTIAIVDGPTVSGPALLLGLVDLVVMTRTGYAFVTGPRVIRDITGVRISGPELGGADVHAHRSGVADLVAVDLDDAWDHVAELLSYLPDHTDVEPPRHPTADAPTRSTPEVAALLPETSMGSYDVREVVAGVVDDAHLVELRPGWAPNLVTALATLDGRPVGIVANQPRSIAGTLDIPASQKGARFVSWCDAFGLPLVTFVDTPGFYPGKDLEWRGMIRKGAQLAFAYARATVPRVSVTLRKSYGGAFIVMDAKTMGNDLALAWPTAEIAVMGARGAVEILHRRADAADKAELEADYSARLLNPWMAAERGYLDTVIDPADTRVALCAGLDLLDTKRETLVTRAHDNSPL
jgi:acetyl-CoA carboxylase carboxyltransferase component